MKLDLPGDSEGIRTDRACRSCGSEGLLAFLSLGPTPLTDAYVSPEQAGEPEPRYPLDVAFCANCTLVQIPAVVPPEAIFERYSYYSSFSDTLLAHSREHVRQLISDNDLGAEDLVVEVASNDGYLLRYFVDEAIPVLGIDPARGPADAAESIGVPTLREFFGVDLANRLRSEGRAADVLIANNVLAHVPDLNGFIEGIATILSPDGVCEIEVPYVRELVDRLEFDTIYHEHLCYFSVTALDALFSRHGLSIDAVRLLPIHGGSLRVTVGRHGERGPSVQSYLDEEAAQGMHAFPYYARFAERVAEVQQSLRTLLHRVRGEGKTIAAYGAAAKGTILLNSSRIGSDVIAFVADANPHKQGKLMPGVGIPIAAPERIFEDMPDYVVLLVWNLKEEVMHSQRAYLESGGKFIVPIPSPVEVGIGEVEEAASGVNGDA
jgi:SAM-dependent methyltransferase